MHFLQDRNIIIHCCNILWMLRQQPAANVVLGNIVACKTVVFGIKSMSGVRKFSRGKVEWKFSPYEFYLSSTTVFHAIIKTIAKDNNFHSGSAIIHTFLTIVK